MIEFFSYFDECVEGYVLNELIEVFTFKDILKLSIESLKSFPPTKPTDIEIFQTLSQSQSSLKMRFQL